MGDVTLESVLSCPHCGFTKRESMPTDACQFYYEFSNCMTLLRPDPGDCCVCVVRSDQWSARRSKRIAGVADNKHAVTFRIRAALRVMRALSPALLTARRDFSFQGKR